MHIIERPGYETRRNRVEIETPSASCAVVAMFGEHDLADYEPIRHALELATRRRRHVIVDLTNCEFIDSTTVSLLLHARDEVISGGGTFGIVLPASESAVRRVAQVMSFDSLFTLYATVAAALLVPPPGPDYFAS